MVKLKIKKYQESKIQKKSFYFITDTRNDLFMILQ